MNVAPALVLSLVSSLLPTGTASEGTPPILQPATYQSPSGVYELYVDPTRRDGGGPGHYRMTRGGELLWEKELPVSLWDAGLTDEGHTAGYAFSNGWRDRRAKGSLHILMLDAAGEVILDEATQRAPSRTMSRSPRPSATQLFVEGDLARVRVLIDEIRSPWVWRTYRISDGERLAEWQPGNKAEARTVPRHFGDARRAARESMEVRTSPAPSPIRLLELGTTALKPRVVSTPGPIRDVRAFRLTEEGAIEFVRGGGLDCTYVTLSKNGVVLSQMALPNLEPASGGVTWYPGTGDTWIAAVCDWGNDGRFKLHRVNVCTGDHKPILSFSCPKIKSVVSTDDGGFVLLGTTRGATSRARMIAVDAADEVLWREDGMSTSHKYESELFATSAMARTSAGFLVVLSTGRDSVQVFSASGEFLRFIDLELAWGHEPRYPARIVADDRGGFCVEDDDKLWRMTLEGELLESWKPESSREAPFSVRGARFAEDGTLWNVVGDLFVSRQADGAQGASFGTPASEQAIEKPNGGWVDRKGQIYIHDRRGEAWHVFNRAGEPLAILTPPVSFTTGRPVNEHPTLGPGGHWFVPPHYRREELGHYEFSTSGEPLRQVQLGSARAQLRGNKDGAWCVVDYSKALALVDKGEVVRSLTRRPDRMWFSRVDDYHLSADGSTLAVLDGSRGTISGLGSVLCIYDGDGAPKLALDLPGAFKLYRVATTHRWAVVADFTTGLLLIDIDSHEVRRVELEPSKNVWRWSFSPDGRELWGVEIGALLLHRFALPE